MTHDVHSAWARLGGGLSVPPAEDRVDVEDLLVRTLGMAREDARLFWVAASWVAVHHSLVNTRRLVGRLRGMDGEARAVAGALFGVARQAAGAASMLDSVLKHCTPADVPRPLFRVMEENAVLTAKVREGALPLFARWGFWQDEVSLRTDAIRPVRWVLAHCPELQSRAVLGAALEAEIVDVLLAAPATVQDLSRICGTTYSAAFEAAARLLGRGWLSKHREGSRQVLGVTPEMAGWYRQFPGATDAVPERLAAG
jgi:hypothetical protein